MESRLEHRIARAEHSCGCPEGAAAALVAASVYFAFALWPSLHAGAGAIAMRILGAFAVLVVSASVGKFIGRTLAAFEVGRLRRKLARIRALTAQPS